ncbi:uncharacterized protein A4U43_C01F26890 [Asparagus officinalis]|uniref:TLC domain-containing protein n=1 Tax=Asparagus officinalis TaxID=4686 RepID=A0A5P1FWF5_ASPOF|nr:transmembrane protein 136-like [Asparagus officinalis]ONK81241.1 uncharacterized protein A4U43_C01F26890 [Asparagus officinalis]
MGDSVMNWIISATICWTATFLLIRRIFPRRSFDFSNRLVSTIHASLAVCLASLSVQGWRCPVCPQASESSPLQMKTLVVTLSYLIYDLICCLFHKQVNLEDVFHHTISIVGIGAGLAYQKSASELVAALWVSEISSPLLHVRKLLKELGYRDTDLNFVADISFALVFTFGRMIAGPYVTFETWMADNPLLIKIMAMGLQLVSTFWFYKIVRMARYKLAKRMKSK